MATDSGLSVPEQRLVSCGDISCEFLIDPIPRPQLDPIKVNYKPRSRGVLLIDHQKPNSPNIMKRATDLLNEAGIPSEYRPVPNATASGAFPHDLMEEYATDDRLLVYGVND